MSRLPPIVLLRGGGDLATGVAARLWRSGFWVVVTEIERPLAVRRLVALAEAVYEDSVTVEDLTAARVDSVEQALRSLQDGAIPVLVDPDAECRTELEPAALIDGRMRKRDPELGRDAAPLVIGLGPGFRAGVNCHVAIETNSGHRMGRVIWEGTAEPDTGVPDPVAGRAVDRVLRAPAAGLFQPLVEIGTLVKRGTVLAEVDGAILEAPFDGALRGLLHWGVEVRADLKVGDLDPRNDPALCALISDKALAVGGGALEALLSRPDIRARLAGA